MAKKPNPAEELKSLGAKSAEPRPKAGPPTTITLTVPADSIMPPADLQAFLQELLDTAAPGAHASFRVR